MKQQDVSFFWDGNDLIIAIHNAKPDAATFVSALLAAGCVQKDNATVAPIFTKPYSVPKISQQKAERSKQTVEQNTVKERKSGLKMEHTGHIDTVRQVHQALDNMEPVDYLKGGDSAFRALSVYWHSNDPFKHKETASALASYMMSRFRNVKDARKYAAKLTENAVDKFLFCFISAYTAEEQNILQNADIQQKRKLIETLIIRCNKQGRNQEKNKK